MLITTWYCPSVGVWSAPVVREPETQLKDVCYVGTLPAMRDRTHEHGTTQHSTAQQVGFW